MPNLLEPIVVALKRHVLLKIQDDQKVFVHLSFNKYRLEKILLNSNLFHINQKPLFNYFHFTHF